MTAGSVSAGGGQADGPLLCRPGGGTTGRGALGALAARVADVLPAATGVVNLCERRDAFMLGFVAALLRGQPTLLPPSRSPQAIDEVLAEQPGATRLDDAAVTAALASGLAPAPAGDFLAAIPADRVVAIGYTSGSTGRPTPNPKTWASLVAPAALNAAALRDQAGLAGTSVPMIVATVPPQHMYGLETSIMLPLVEGLAVHSGRPLFPADVAAALADAPAPRLLVSTPLHLRTLVESRLEFPPVALVISATAPLAAPLAAQVEAAFRCPLLEFFGSTETCVIASRRTAAGEDWRAHAGVTLAAGESGTTVTAPWLPAATGLQDLVELLPGGRFRLRGRNTDLIEVAGKRASLAGLTRRLLAVDGVRDAVVFQPDDDDGAGVRRLAALAVAPGRNAAELLGALAGAVDPMFLPRPLRVVAELPRNELGKLPRAALLALLRSAAGD